MLFISPMQWLAKPQTGSPRRVTWERFAEWLSRPRVPRVVTGDRHADKACEGAWSPALYRGGVRRKDALVHASALVVDVDIGGDVNHVADVLATSPATMAIVHETYSSTPDAPHCRVVLALAAPIDAPTYEATHVLVRALMRAAGAQADDGAKDATRASYTPVRPAGAGYAFRVVEGDPVDAHALLAAQPPPPPRSAPRLVAPEHRDRYVRGALDRAAREVAGRAVGDRHHTLAKEAFTLARLSVPEDQIYAVLLPAFVSAAGESRRREGERTIRDSVAARRRTA